MGVEQFPTVWAFSHCLKLPEGICLGNGDALTGSRAHSTHFFLCFWAGHQILQPRCVTEKSCSALNNISDFSQVLQRFKSGVCFNQRDKREPACPRDLTTQVTNAWEAGKAVQHRAQGSRAWSQAPNNPRDPPSPGSPALQHQQKIVQSKHSSLRAISIRGSAWSEPPCAVSLQSLIWDTSRSRAFGSSLGHMLRTDSCSKTPCPAPALHCVPGAGCWDS